MNIFETFADWALSNINESALKLESPLKFKVNFLLKEAKAPKERKPWNSREDWIAGNPKVEKNTDLEAIKKNGKQVEFQTYLINMLPAKQSGVNLCMCSSKACAATCLHTSGNIGALVNKTVSRLRKTWFFVLEREKAVSQIRDQIFDKLKTIRQENVTDPSKYRQLVIRLNGTQDINWQSIKDDTGKTLFEQFPDVMFYDYTKVPKMMDQMVDGTIPSNYHLTFSYNGSFTPVTEKYLSKGQNLAVPFGPGKTWSGDEVVFPSSMMQLFKNFRYPQDINTKTAQEEYRKMIVDIMKKKGAYAEEPELAPFVGKALLPGLFHCYEVIDGDKHDARFLDDVLHANEEETSFEADYQSKMNKRYGLVAGLTAKGALTYDFYDSDGEGWGESATGFMVGPSDPGLESCSKEKINDDSKQNLLVAKTNTYKKVAKGILILRNFDARNSHGDKTHIDIRLHSENPSDKKKAAPKTPPKQANLSQTYKTAKERVPDELSKLSNAMNYVFNLTPGYDSSKLNPEFVKKAQDLKTYLSKSNIQSMLKDPEFLSKAKDAGIGIDFESLSRLLGQVESGDTRGLYKDPSGQTQRTPLTMLPKSIIDTLGKKTESINFTDWMDFCEVLKINKEMD